MQMSTFSSRHAKKKRKGNHRRKNQSGGFASWGFRKDLLHSFNHEEALST